jgi:hypothetical protein
MKHLNPINTNREVLEEFAKDCSENGMWMLVSPDGQLFATPDLTELIEMMKVKVNDTSND